MFYFYSTDRGLTNFAMIISSRLKRSQVDQTFKYIDADDEYKF